MNNVIKTAAISLFILLISVTGAAQEKVEISIGADVVSRYIWRGFDQGTGASVQPSIEMNYRGFFVEAWGNTGITDFDSPEVDFTLGYTIGGLSLCITDYWWTGENSRYGDYKNNHYFEGMLCYEFGEKVPLTLSVATMFAGGDKDEDGKQCYSTYFNAAYAIDCPLGITLTPSIGATTASYLHTGERVRGITDIALKASKELKITSRFSLPLFVEVIASPVNDKVFMAVGITL